MYYALKESKAEKVMTMGESKFWYFVFRGRRMIFLSLRGNSMQKDDGRKLLGVPAAVAAASDS